MSRGRIKNEEESIVLLAVNVNCPRIEKLDIDMYDFFHEIYGRVMGQGFLVDKSILFRIVRLLLS